MRALAIVLVLAAAACGSSRDDAERKARAARAHAEEVARAQLRQLDQRTASVRAELDKVYHTTSSYDLDITTQAATSEHAAKLAAMPHVTVGELTVGYEQTSGVSITGTSSARHFRATWRRGDRDVIVGYQTESNLDLAAFAALLQKLVPIVERTL